MAIDTAEKRKSVAVIHQVYMAPGITPDATPDELWRQVAAWGYYGIAVFQPPAPAAGNGYVGFICNAGTLVTRR